MILDGIEEAGQKVRKVYQRRLPSNPTKDYNFLFRGTGVTEPVIVEYGFIDNKDDITRVVNNYQKYAEAVVKAVTEYKNLPYVSPNTDNEIIYIVKSGDSLWSIAKKYNTKVNIIKEFNNLTSDLLKVGQQLIIPKDNNVVDNTKYHIVKLGDTLYSIANKYNTTVNNIKELNNLTSNILSVDQKLLIPQTDNYIDYTVKSGDSLWQISRLYNTTVNEIKSLNNLTSDLLSIGQILKIPV